MSVGKLVHKLGQLGTLVRATWYTGWGNVVHSLRQPSTWLNKSTKLKAI